jgi:phage-related protein
MAWTVETLNAAVDAEVNALSADMRAQLTRISFMVREFGLEQMREPHVKHLQGPIWEMRLRGRDGIARALYVAARDRLVVIVRVFVKKTQKTPSRESTWPCAGPGRCCGDRHTRPACGLDERPRLPGGI